MTVVGLNFTKIAGEKNKPIKGQIEIKNNVMIKDISESKFSMDEKRSALKFDFEFLTLYEPKIGSIKLNGEVIYLTDKKIATDVLKVWKDEKKAKAFFMKDLMNHVFVRCNVEAVLMSRELNLPTPIPMPKIK